VLVKKQCNIVSILGTQLRVNIDFSLIKLDAEWVLSEISDSITSPFGIYVTYYQIFLFSLNQNDRQSTY
jgi:hypothetical protein